MERSNDMHSVFVAWQDPATRAWRTIARLTEINRKYEFEFTQGATNLKEVVRHLFNSNVTDRFRSDSLISLFRNKIPPRTRPDYKKMSAWLNLTGNESEFELLSRFGLFPGSDGIMVYPAPTLVNGRYSIEFFLHGIRHAHGEPHSQHLRADVLRWCENAKEGDRLYPLLDPQNEYDSNAVALRDADGSAIVGYVPRFYSRDIRDILVQENLAKEATFRLLRNNTDAPLQSRILCRFDGLVDQNFKPLDDAEHRPFPYPEFEEAL